MIDAVDHLAGLKIDDRQEPVRAKRSLRAPQMAVSDDVIGCAVTAVDPTHGNIPLGNIAVAVNVAHTELRPRWPQFPSHECGNRHAAAQEPRTKAVEQRAEHVEPPPSRLHDSAMTAGTNQPRRGTYAPATLDRVAALLPADGSPIHAREIAARLDTLGVNSIRQILAALECAGRAVSTLETDTARGTSPRRFYRQPAARRAA